MSKQLILLRHARAEWPSGQRFEDIDKPLNQMGEKQAPAMGTSLRDRGIQPQAIISSPAHRAITTARIIAEYINFPKNQIQEDRRIYENTIEDLLAVIQEIDDEHQSVILIGHNPALSMLGASLCPEEPVVNLPPCGVYQVDIDCDSWMNIERHQGNCTTYHVEEFT